MKGVIVPIALNARAAVVIAVRDVVASLLMKTPDMIVKPVAADTIQRHTRHIFMIVRHKIAVSAERCQNRQKN